MGSTRTALVSYVQTIWSFANVVWILSVSVERFLSGAQYVCRAETGKRTVEKIRCDRKEVRVRTQNKISEEDHRMES